MNIEHIPRKCKRQRVKNITIAFTFFWFLERKKNRKHCFSRICLNKYILFILRSTNEQFVIFLSLFWQICTHSIISKHFSQAERCPFVLLSKIFRLSVIFHPYNVVLIIREYDHDFVLN